MCTFQTKRNFHSWGHSVTFRNLIYLPFQLKNSNVYLLSVFIVFNEIVVFKGVLQKKSHWPFTCHVRTIGTKLSFPAVNSGSIFMQSYSVPNSIINNKKALGFLYCRSIGIIVCYSKAENLTCVSCKLTG